MKGRYQLITQEDVDEGFEHQQNETELLVPHVRNIEFGPQSYISLQPPTQKKAKIKSSERHILKLDSLQSTNINMSTLSRHSKAASLIHARLDQGELARIQETENRSLIIKKSRRLNKQRSLEKIVEEEQCILYKKNGEIGEDLIIRQDTQALDEIISHQLRKNQFSTIIYRYRMPNSTHSYFKNLTKHQTTLFVQHKYNIFLKQKLDRFKVQPIQKEKGKKTIEFKSDFQSGNLEASIKIASFQYNLFIRNDTHTNGHQNWFYFKVTNHQKLETTIKLNICNLKRRFKMIEKGQKLFISRNGIWTLLNQEIQMVNVQKRVYKLSFSLTLLANQSLYIALIPPYSYSQLLQDIDFYQKSPNSKVQILTYSVSGLAIPILTITKNAKRMLNNQKRIRKKLFLISGRIHPSQTCSSYIINGLISHLLQNNPENEQFLTHATVKIVPMLNPDGVVFGNFRTSYLGDDLNRAFNQSDQAIYPEVTALKQLAKTLKVGYGQNFLAFIDMHGHSCRTNSFVYGPQFQQSSEEFVECRVFPKILDKISKYFSYDISSFKLQQYKINTARGCFLMRYKIPSYTIQTSYALYQPKNEGQSTYNKMSIEEWTELGRQLSQTLQIYVEYVLSVKQKQATQPLFKKKIPSKNSFINKPTISKVFFNQLYNEIKQETSQKSSKKSMNEPNSSDSDGEPMEQDWPIKQKQSLIKSVRDTFQANNLLPKTIKPIMILPAIVPSIMVVSRKQQRQLNLAIPKISSKMRQKKFARPLNYNSEFNEYLLKNTNNISSIKPDVINFNTLIAKKLKQRQEKS